MGRVNTPLLDEKAKTELDKRFRSDQRHAVRMRCQSVLLKAEGRNAKEVAGIVKMSVNNWLSRYKQEGIQSLVTKPGRGRKAVIFTGQEQQSALDLIKINRQKLQTAKAEWETQQGKPSGRDAFRRFLNVMAGDTNGFASDRAAGR